MGIPWHDLLNLEKYTVPELFLFCGGCFMWVFIYMVYVRQIFKKQYIEMPTLAACGNVGWELVWGWRFQTDMGILMVWCYRAWFFIDLIILYGVLRYGWKQIASPNLRKHFVPTHVVLTFAWIGFYWLFVLSGLDTPIGATSAFICNLVISSLYIALILGRSDLSKLSWTIAWLKMIGTGTNTIFMNIHPEYADNYFLHYISILTTTLDCIYIYLFWRMRKAGELAPRVSD